MPDQSNKTPKKNPKKQAAKAEENPMHNMDFHEIMKRGIRVKSPKNS